MASVQMTMTAVKRSNLSMRRILRYAVLLLAGALLLRVVWLEPFCVTSGSMAPLLLGVHRECECPNCGFPILVGAPPPEVDAATHYDVRCPNCGQGSLGLERQPDVPGQRLLVDKLVYEWRKPRRWELIVFRRPGEKDPFVKRVVGLPGESVQIKNGDVYIDGEISRKPYDVMKETCVLIYDGRYPVSGRWNLDGPVEETMTGLQFRCKNDESATARFYLPPIFGNGPVTDHSVYNGAKVNRIENINGLMFSCSMKLDDAIGSCTIADESGVMPARVCSVRPTQDLVSEVADALDKAVNRPSKHSNRTRVAESLREGQTVAVFASISSIRMLAINGKEHSWWQPIESANLNGSTPSIELSVEGRMTIHNIRIYRDVHYQSVGRHGITSPWRLGPDEYFVLGDNSPCSDDSRSWAEPGVLASQIIGKPIVNRP